MKRFANGRLRTSSSSACGEVSEGPGLGNGLMLLRRLRADSGVAGFVSAEHHRPLHFNSFRKYCREPCITDELLGTMMLLGFLVSFLLRRRLGTSGTWLLELWVETDAKLVSE